ncbi:uncharacterized protein LOC129583507 isoform X2 [Paramacrobiotus metropolitanus]|uniref:uncharacterized protein LOC129583507 isoform X2 n=1 Tax=Paramacrobiotus metropolitanus TaxID=2943436 RepID=UPI002445D80C|nr:uncharacterized protein LOC129583507 isoform X2 [Paramacrobiotus metropolitanus]
MVGSCFASKGSLDSYKLAGCFKMTNRMKQTKAAACVDLSEKQIAEFRESFDHFDRNDGVVLYEIAKSLPVSSLYAIVWVRLLGDRYITIRELKEVVEKLGFRPTIEQLKIFMAEADADKNGKIDFGEFLGVMRSKMGEMLHMTELERAFKVFDYNDDGRISRAELRGVFKSLEQHFTEEQITEMIKVADKNADGYIDFDEFSGLVDSFS